MKSSTLILYSISFSFIFLPISLITIAFGNANIQDLFQVQSNIPSTPNFQESQPTMSKAFLDALATRRSFYSLTASSPISDTQIQSILTQTLSVIPSSFNSQSTRMLLLLHDEHRTLWSSTLSILENMGKATDLTRTKLGNFGNAYGTVLFFEDQEVLDKVGAKMPTFAEKAPQYSEHTNAMHQIAVWTALEQEGFGANLQHYSPIVDEMVQKTWGVPVSWNLKAQMVFGTPSAQPGPKNNEGKPSAEERLWVRGQRLPN